MVYNVELTHAHAEVETGLIVYK